MQSDDEYRALARRCASGHILVDEDSVDEVMAVVTSEAFGSLPGAHTDTPDKAGLVALCWHNDERDPAEVVARIRQLAPELQDAVSPDHTVGLLHSRTGDERGASIEMGGPATDAGVTKETFARREDSHVAGRGVFVGVIDSGIVGNPWLDGSFLASPESIDPLDEDGDRELDRMAGHGVFVAGIIIREAPAAVVRVVRAFDKDGYVRIRRAAQAIVELDELGCDVINLSFGGYTPRDRPPLAHRKAVSKIRDTTVVVAASGNHKVDDPDHAAAPERKFWPAALDRVVAVAALETNGSGIKMAPFSNRGGWVDIAAPGANVLGPYVTHKTPKGDKFNGWARWSGTSFAAPMVAGRIAATMTDASGNRVRSAQKAKEMVIEDAGLTRPPTLAIASDVIGRFIL